MKKPSKTPINPHEIYLHAFRFHESDIRLRNSISPEDPNEVMLIAHPSMMLSAFASELYLKCLLYIETGKIHSGHNLKSLFLRLDLQTREHIENLWNEYNRRTDRQKELKCIRLLPGGERLEADLQYALWPSVCKKCHPTFSSVRLHYGRTVRLSSELARNTEFQFLWLPPSYAPRHAS